MAKVLISVVCRSNSGGLAQLGERLHGMQEVRGSSPLSSTFFARSIFLIYFIPNGRSQSFVVGKTIASNWKALRFPPANSGE